MTIIEALENALSMLRTQGIASGDIVDDLELAIVRLRTRFPQAAGDKL